MLKKLQEALAGVTTPPTAEHAAAVMNEAVNRAGSMLGAVMLATGAGQIVVKGNGSGPAEGQSFLVVAAIDPTLRERLRRYVEALEADPEVSEEWGHEPGPFRPEGELD